jgi:hypothetical protein
MSDVWKRIVGLRRAIKRYTKRGIKKRREISFFIENSTIKKYFMLGLFREHLYLINIFFFVFKIIKRRI